MPRSEQNHLAPSAVSQMFMSSHEGKLFIELVQTLGRYSFSLHKAERLKVYYENSQLRQVQHN